MQVIVENPNTIVIDVDQGRQGRGIQNITYTEVSGQYFLIVTYTDGTTETLGPLVVTGGAAFLLGGATGSIPYQSAPNTTVFLPIGTQNQVVVAGTSAPQYTSALTGLTVNNSAIGNTAPSTGAFTNLSASGTFALTGDQVQISEGGTGQTTANGAFNALAPSQTGNAGKYLKTDGTNAAWDQLDISTADITGVLPVANGGTGASTAAGARANLSAAILGTNNDITSMTGVTGGISTPDFVQFDTTATEANAVGKVYWDAAQGTLDLGLLGGNVVSRIGQSLVAYVTNAEAVTITKGQAVYLFGAQGNRATVKLASNLSDATSAKTFGVVAENIPANGTGFVMCQGVLEGLNLGAFTAGDTLYLGATPGSLTATKPYAPNHLVYVGLVERANAGNGQLYVKVQNGYELDEIHDVQIINPQNGQTIIYDASTSLWKNANLTAGTGISVTNGAASVTIGNTGVLSFSGGTTGLTPATSTTGAVTLGGTLAVASGGTGATTAGGALTNLGAASSAITISAGTGLTGGGDLTANRTLSIANTAVTAASYGSASSVGTFTVNAQGQLTAAASTPIAIANTQVSGLGTMSTQNSNSVTITGGSITGITDLAIADGGTGASDAPTARTNLGLGTSATLNAGVALGVATLDAGGTVPLSQLPASIQGGVSYQGSWDAATNTPTIVSSVGSKGYYYVVSVAGSTNINGITDWLPGDWIIFNGSVWQKIDNTDAVASVNGYTGVVVLNAADVGAAPTSRTITAGTGLTGGGDLSANRTISIANTTVAAGSYGSASSVGTFTVNGQGQLTAAASTPIAITNTQVSGLGTMSTQNASAVAITGGSITGITDLAVADGGTGASDAATARTNLGAAASAITISAGTGLSGGGDLSANRTLSIANTTVTAASYGSASSVGTFTVNAQGQLTAAASTPIAIANTQVSGLGTMSTQNANAVAITGGSVDGTTIGGTTRAAGSFTTLTLTNALGIANGGTNGTATPTAGAVAYGTGTAYSFTPAGTSNQVLISNGAAAPSWANLSSLGVTSFSAGTTGLTPSTGTAGAVTLGGTLATTNGGTGLTSFSANQVFYASSTSAVAQSANLQFSGTDLTVYGITVGRGAGAIATNTAVGASALAANTTGSENTAVGSLALRLITSGANNTALGNNVLSTSTTGNFNTAIGNRSMQALTTGSYNVGLGTYSLYVNTTGQSNVAIGGYGPLLSNTTGSNNVAVGDSALTSNTTASNNTAVGYQAGYSNTTGANINAFGRAALYTNSTGIENVAIGNSSLYYNTTGGYNTAVGTNSLANNTTASYNTAVGYQAAYFTTGTANSAFGALALNQNTTGAGNAAFGTFYQGVINAALYSNTTGANNSAFGSGALSSNTTGSNNVAMGLAALQANTTASNNTAVGYQAAYSSTTGTQITAIGYQAVYSGNADRTVGIGYQALFSNTGDRNTAIGWTAMAATTSGAYNVGVGHEALRNNTTASNAVAVGYNALRLNTTGESNTGVGAYALTANTTGSFNTAFGNNALPTNTTGSLNVAVGRTALLNATGSDNTAVGGNAAQQTTTGTALVVVGKEALYANTTGSYNTAIGTQALLANTTASNNTAVGYQAGYSNTTGTANTYLGEGAGFSNTTSSYNTFIGEAAGRSFNTSGNSGNTFVGVGAGYGTTTGTANTFVGAWNPATTVGCGQLVTTGSKNTILGAYNGNQGGLDIRTASNYIVLSDGDGNPRVYVNNSGDVFLQNGNWNISNGGGTYNAVASWNKPTTGNQYACIFRYTGTIVGSIESSDTATSYVTSSDYRLKDNIRPMMGALAKVQALRPVTYTWKLDGSAGQGFIAHELQEICPQAVTGEKDAVDENGNIKPQGIDTSFLVATLTAAIQELKSELDSVKAELATLKGA